MKKKSIGLNAVINGLKTLISLIFPLITYPYISRVLEVENLGKYNFAHSVIDYFYLLSALGIATYAVREGTRHRSTKEEISQFASEVFTINVVATILSYLLLGVTIFVSPKLQNYTSIIMILSISMVFTTLGCEWVYTIYEEYFYITIRTIVFQAISLLLMFVFVKSKDDVLWYAIVIVISSSGANIINLLGLNKYCKIKICFNKKILIHLAPILILFANSVTTRIYVNSGTTILGFLTSDYNVGIYTIASKIYSIAKQVLSAIIIVSIPRLSLYWGQKRKEEYQKLANGIIYALVILVLPAAVGLFSLSEEVVLIIGGNDFLASTKPLQFLSVALMVCIFNWFFTSCVLIPTKREKYVLIATIISALLNVAINFALIPILEETAAAIATLVAETCSLIICIWNSKEVIKIDIRYRDIISALVGCVCIYIICCIVREMHLNVVICIGVALIGSCITYLGILLILKNQSLLYVVDILYKKVKNKKY